jgi:hypothetical protein
MVRIALFNDFVVGSNEAIFSILINYKARLEISKGVGVYRIIELSAVLPANEGSGVYFE